MNIGNIYTITNSSTVSRTLHGKAVKLISTSRGIELDNRTWYKFEIVNGPVNIGAGIMMRFIQIPENMLSEQITAK